ncbi:DUF1963 domain-containing protein [Variovorax sp. W6]|uniref:DUF1963 domain-containing protein n=1 Tax=Variovorax sp. W6 TaxID=3093895 RepID=UPI003D8096FA
MSSNQFQIGKYAFEFAPDTEVLFEDGGMSFNLKARPVAFDKTLHAPPFDPEGSDNPAPGQIAPSFWSSTFHFHDNHDAPHRRVRYLKNQPTHGFYMWEKGFAFGTRFFGEIDLRPDRIEMHGLLRHDYETDEQGVAVHVVWNCARGEVQLRPYTYSSFEEAMAAPPERVRRLLVSPWDARWRDELLRFTQLEFLSLEDLWTGTPETAITALPESFCKLTRLRELYLRTRYLARLPEDLGALEQLEVLSLQHCRIEALPDSIGQLAKLRRLLLDGNQLTTLPESVGKLPALELLSINRNPFESLPASLQNIAKVDIEKKNEALFRDIRYRPDVEVAVDREAFMACSSPRHVALLGDALARHGLTDYEGPLRRNARQALRLCTTQSEDYATPGSTRIGGTPDLPPGIDYPSTDGRLWRFYAQIDLAEIAALQSWLPRTGRLYFFGEGQEEGDGVRVLHSDAPASALLPHAWPEDGEFSDGCGVGDAHEGFKVRIDATVSLPNLYNAGGGRLSGEDSALLAIDKDDGQQEAYWALEAEFGGDGEGRNGAHLMNAHVFTQHENPQEQASRDKGGLPEEWVNLLTLRSDSKPGFCFWDAGTITFSIHEKDLAIGDFSRVHWSLESS